MEDNFSSKEKRVVKSKSICEFSVKDLKNHIEFVNLKENLVFKKKENSSQSRNKLKIYLGKDRNSVKKLMNTAVSLLKSNNILSKMANVI